MGSSVRFPSSEDIKKRIIDAIVALYRYDYELIDKNANERSITHKLAEHLQKEFPYWHVDCEYNRYGNETKKLLNSERVFPDIIIHHRGKDENLVVIEAKKQFDRSSISTKKDEKKLKKFSEDPHYKYQYAFLLIISERNPTLKRYIQENDKWDDWSQSLKKILKEIVYGE